MPIKSIPELQTALQKFAAERDWEQFHTPKNLATALSVEASELLEIFQWLTDKESENLTKEQAGKLSEEIGDVMIYLARLADRTGIDLLEVAHRKLEVNIQKYPSDQVRGSAKKYTEYE